MGKLIDLTGQNFGRWTVLYRSRNPKYKKPYWTCECECGNIVDVESQNLRNGKSKSCGCYHKEIVSNRTPNNYIDLSGQIFGRLKVVERAQNRHGRTYYKCECECGTIKEICSISLVSGRSKSCGCLATEIRKNNTYSKNKIKEYAPWILDFVDKNDKEKISNLGISSSKKIFPICPICNIQHKKAISINNIYRNHGFGCINCTKIRSLGERIMFYILKQINIDFDCQKIIKEGSLQRYDFYLPEYKISIEIDGGQHPTKLDSIKDRIALDNGIHMIRINAYKSDFDYIFNNIVNSELKDVIDLNMVTKCEIYENTYQNSYGMILSDFRNAMPISELVDKYKITEPVIRKYLRKANKLGLCEYSYHRKTVRCINNGMIFNSASDASKWCGLCNGSSIRAVCDGKRGRHTAGKHPKTGEKLKWEYVKTI